MCPKGQEHSWQPYPRSPEDMPPLEPGKYQGQNQGSYPMPEGSHEMAAALLPVGILHAGNLLDNFGEDAMSQLQGIEIQGKKISSL